MAFIGLPGAALSPVEIFRQGQQYLVKIDIGYDDGSDRIYSLLVNLDMAPGVLWELSFCIVEYDGATGETRDFYSGKETIGVIPRRDRALIKARLMEAVRELIGAAQPDRLSMCTFDRPLPRKAEIKYVEIAQVVAECGYAVNRSEPYNDQTIWWMDRLQPSKIMSDEA